MALDPKSVNPDGSQTKGPVWKRHFPIDTAAESASSRRAFLGGLTVAGGVMASGQVALQMSNAEGGQTSNTDYEPLVLEKKLDELQDSEALLFHFPDHRTPCILIKHSATDVIAFTQKCTHLACPVIPDLKHNHFHCPCHHGSFDLKTGEPLGGPPTTGLQKVTILVAPDGTLTATAIEG